MSDGNLQSATSAELRHANSSHNFKSTGPMGTGHEIMLQGFNWECHTIRDHARRPAWLAMLADKADAIADAGITAVWLPPPCHSISDEGYLPQDYERLSTAYGSEADLRRCVGALRQRRIKALADVVLNHRCAQEKGPDGKWNRFTGRYAWDAGWLCSNQYEQFGGTGASKPEEMVFPHAPNLDHSQERLRQSLVSYLSWLKEQVGYSGWRFDFVKGFDGSAVKEYIAATCPEMAVGEFWKDCNYDEKGGLVYDQDSHRQAIVDWCDATGGAATAFDFTTKGIVQDALEKKEFWRLKDAAGKPPGVVGWWPSRAVTFLDNHDTGSTQQHWPFPPACLQQGYAYILTHPGTPCVFYDHLWSDGSKRTSVWGSLKRLLSSSHKQVIAPGSSLDRAASVASSGELSSGPGGRPRRRPHWGRDAASALRAAVLELISVRRRNGIHCRSLVNILQADGGAYAAVVDGRVAVKLGPAAWNPAGAGVKPPSDCKDWTVAASGIDWAVWEAAGGREGSQGGSAPRAIPGAQS